MIITRPSKIAGFTLIEVLVSVFILAVGLLGFAALQLTAINNNQEGYFKSQATIIAQDVASRMRANRTYVNWDTRAVARATALGAIGDQNLYVSAVATTGYTCAAVRPAPNCSALPAANPAAPAVRNACDEQEMAAFDVWEVCDTARQVLPSGQVHVTCANKDQIAGATIVYIAGQVNPRINAHNDKHRYFQPDPSFIDPTLTPVTLVGVDATDTCSPGSHHSIYVSWLKGATRTEGGESDLDTDNTNSRCYAVDELNLPITRDCVAIDLVP